MRIFTEKAMTYGPKYCADHHPVRLNRMHNSISKLIKTPSKTIAEIHQQLLVVVGQGF